MKSPSRWRRPTTRWNKCRILPASQNEVLKARDEASRVTDRRFEQNCGSRFRTRRGPCQGTFRPGFSCSKRPWACPWPKATSSEPLASYPASAFLLMV